MKTRPQSIRDAIESLRRKIANANGADGADGSDSGGSVDGAGGDGDGNGGAAVTVVAAAKTFPAADIRSAAAAGIRDIGENYLQEAQTKMRATADLPLRWHFIGRLQSNKAAAVARVFDFVHSVADSAIARRLSAARGAANAESPLQVFLQVNPDGETGKGGIPPAEAAAAAAEIATLPHLTLAGLMCIPDPGKNPRAAFRAMRRLRGEINESRGLQLRELSMGMSADFAEALAEGATFLRIGSAIFGARPAQQINPPPSPMGGARGGETTNQ